MLFSWRLRAPSSSGGPVIVFAGLDVGGTIKSDMLGV